MSNRIPPIVPMSSPDLTDADRQAVMAVLNTPNLSIGPKIEEFEAAFRKLTGAKHAIGVNSGTAGLHLCVRAAGIGADRLVVTTPFSFVSSTNVLLFENATPVFVDVDPMTGNLDVQQTALALRDLAAGGDAAKRWLPRSGVPENVRPGGILGVDVFGQPADWDALRQLADEYGLPLIEDSCEALGAEYKGRRAGLLGDYGVFAFYPNKQITTGEGGLIVTDDDAAAAQMRALRNQGRAPGDTWLSHTFLGYNYRMDELSAALGVSQLARLEELLQKRQRVADWYARGLQGIAGVEAPQLVPSTTRVSWFVYVIRIAPGIDRQALADRLAERGIPVRPYFLPIHLQPYMVERFGYQPGDFPVTEDLGARGLALPFSGVMSEEQVGLVCQALRETL
ncbi:MAG: DegT/DnrJ/EryC1/StrS family aminotransferase [Chloroflexi bacterium]|nr:DegT/DnrJ/EryC1/StrS family aminotransferase [Chloroflexota bacterium]